MTNKENSSNKTALFYLEDIQTGNIRIPKHAEKAFGKVKTKEQLAIRIIENWVNNELENIRSDAEQKVRNEKSD